MKRKYNVYLYEHLCDDAMLYLSKYAKIIVLDDPYSADLNKGLADADALIIRAKGRISEALIVNSRRLKVIGRHGVGLDNIDLDAAKKKGIKVVYTPEANYLSVVEFIICLMICLARNIKKADIFVRSGGNWMEAVRLTGVELHSKTIGIVGAGRIGRSLAKSLTLAFGMKALLYDYKKREFHDLRGLPGISITDDIAKVFSESDFVSINLPLNEKTKGLVGKGLLSKMKRGSFFINTSRGEIVDEEYLAKLIQLGRLSGAALDVFKNEPIAINSKLLAADNLIATPHIAAYTVESFSRMGCVVQDVIKVLEDKQPKWQAV